MTMRGLFAYHPRILHDPRSTATTAALAGCPYPIDSVACTAPGDYDQALRRRWGSDDWLVWEHDVVPTPGMLVDLAECSEPVCAQAYPLWWRFADAERWATMGREWVEPLDRMHPERAEALQRIRFIAQRTASARALYPTTLAACVPVCAHRRIMPAGDPPQERWLHPLEPWADAVGLGLTRFRREWMQAHPAAWAPGSWQDLDSRLSAWWQTWGQRVHVHWGYAAHHHGCPCHSPGSEGPWAAVDSDTIAIIPGGGMVG